MEQGRAFSLPLSPACLCGCRCWCATLQSCTLGLSAHGSNRSNEVISLCEGLSIDSVSLMSALPADESRTWGSSKGEGADCSGWKRGVQMLTIYWLVCVCGGGTVFSWTVSVTVMPYQIRVVWGLGL